MSKETENIETLSFKIFQDGELKKEFKNQTTDLEPFKWLLRNQSNSISHAIRYEGWKVEEINEQSGTVEFWKPY